MATKKTGVTRLWRNVAYGEGRSKRRLRWIMPFLKGPEGTPVIRRPLVRVWR